MTYRYFLIEDGGAEREVTKAQFVRAERQAGFRNTMGQPLEPATNGFGGKGINGRTDFWGDCQHPGCEADMSSEMCPNSHRTLCVDHCGEDHTN